ncbi:MAG: glycosyltransferase [Candidatus Eisenbacteria bacterium]|nr:glycosyltransferase [Candidatus Eisenbacteria bacterium]
MNIVSIALTLAAAPPLAASAYLAALTALSAKRAPGAVSHGLRWVVLVPAHDEAAGIGATLAGLERLRYPREDFRVRVIADNCTDATAAIARAAGAEVHERFDPVARGKGHALRAAIARLLAEPECTWDALAVIDADTEVDPGLLAQCTARLEDGEEALQVAYLPRRHANGAGGAESPGHRARRVALTAFHVVRSRGREALLLSAGLRGNGMAFSRACLAAHPHDAAGRTEDVEYGLQLGLAGVRVGYVDGTAVWGDMPADGEASRVQRSRWVGGRFDLLRREAPKLARRLFTRPDPIVADLLADLLVPPLSLLLGTLALGTALAAAWAFASGDAMPLVCWMIASAFAALHALRAMAVSGDLASPAALLRALPDHVFRQCAVAFDRRNHHARAWVRTPREEAR